MRAGRRSILEAAAVLAALLTGTGCSDGETASVAPSSGGSGDEQALVRGLDLPRSARSDVRDDLVRGRDAQRHASDGGGKAWLVPDPAANALVAGGRGSFELVYEAGPLGVAEGGAVFLQVSPFWGWSTPQTESLDAAGSTEVETEAAGVLLTPRTVDQQLIQVEIGGRELREGERLTIRYGSGPARAAVDTYAEKRSTFWFAVDGDGDGVRSILRDSPTVEVRPGPVTRVVAFLPSVARPGEQVVLRLALLDVEANHVDDAVGRFLFDADAVALGLPSELQLEREDGGVAALPFTTSEPGTVSLRVRFASGDTEFETTTNPMACRETGPRVFWADLHGHSCESDGTGDPEDYYAYARDVAALDVAALTDHDHWGLLPLDDDPERWEAIRTTAQRETRAGSFLGLVGYEYTDWIHGHRHVLWFGEESPMFSSLADDTNTPDELWNALSGRPALSIPHHPAGGPIAFDWDSLGPREIEPCVEIVSGHGSSESPDSPTRIYSPAPGHFARDALAEGRRFAFLGSGDGHDGHPGLTHLGRRYPTGGASAILADDRTPEAILAALRAGRVYATSGPRILLRFSAAGGRMGETVTAAQAAENGLVFVRALGTAPIDRIELIRGAEVVAAIAGNGTNELVLTGDLNGERPLESGEFVYVRVLQADGGLAWASPVFVD